MLMQQWSRPWILAACMLGMTVGQSGFAEDIAEKSSIRWHKSYGKAAKEAKEKGLPLLIGFTATWCGPCRQMQQLTFRDKQVVNYVQSGFVALSLDADENSDLVRGFRVEAFPTTLVVSPELKIVKRFSGYQSSSTLISDLDKVVQEKFAVRDVVQPVSAVQPSNSGAAAFDSFCLVSILDDQKVRRGDGQFATTYRDQQLCFHSESHLKKFLANPAKYWPASSGKCLVSERDGHQETVGDPRMGVTWRGKLWLFADKESQQRFIQSPQKYVTRGI